MDSFKGVGCSGHSEFKQEQFRAFLISHLSICRGIAERLEWDDWEYLYVDLFAGPGFVPSRPTIDGSPLIFLSLARSMGVPYRAFFFEENDGCHRSLTRRVFAGRGPEEALSSHPIHGRFQDQIGRILAHLDRSRERRVGLVYADPNALSPADPSLFHRLAMLGRHPATRYLDLLIHTPATTYKRVRGLEQYRGSPTLEAALAAIGKPRMLVSRPDDRHQWTFLLLTNKRDMELPERSLGWFPTDHPVGEKRLERISLTAAEFQDRAPTGYLPFMTGM